MAKLSNVFATLVCATNWRRSFIPEPSLFLLLHFFYYYLLPDSDNKININLTIWTRVKNLSHLVFSSWNGNSCLNNRFFFTEASSSSLSSIKEDLGNWLIILRIKIGKNRQLRMSLLGTLRRSIIDKRCLKILNIHKEPGVKNSNTLGS